MENKHFIIIEDDVVLAKQFKEMLELESFEVQVYHSSEDFLMGSKINDKLCIYLIDINLPGLNGTELVKVIRHRDKLSHIFIISGEMNTSIFGKSLELGADDFLFKPYNPEHLLLKVINAQSKLRILTRSMMDYGVKLLPEARLISRDGIKLKLTNREYAISECLLRNPEKIHSRESLVKEISDVDITERTIDVHISSLRKKLPELNLEIETLRGKGYRIKSFEARAVAL
jgi:two-component system phosphate regulon response regulator PhoB